MRSSNKSFRKPSGFTLIELVVVVGILAIVGVIVIPTVRTLNEDRKIRDTARVVGSVFAAARERAAVDGQAGVEIVSIQNSNGEYNLPNMGLVLYQLRSVPPYIGDVIDATVVLLPDPDLMDPVGVDERLLDFPAGSDPVLAGVQTFDQIEFNGSGVRLRIRRDDAGTPNILTDDDFYVFGFSSFNPAPNPALPPAAFDPLDGLPFKIYRQPVRVESSAVRLPNNLFLNMALSGHGPSFTPPSDGNQFTGRQFRDFDAVAPVGHPSPGSYPAQEGSTKIWFGPSGAVSHVTTRGYAPGATAPDPVDFSRMDQPSGPIHILMCNGNEDDIDLTNLDSPAFLHDDNNMWITINHRTGGVTMGKMAQTVLSDAVNEQIESSRELARNRRSANP